MLGRRRYLLPGKSQRGADQDWQLKTSRRTWKSSGEGGYKRKPERWGLLLQLILSAFPTIFLEQVQTGALVPPPSCYQAWLARVHAGSSSVWDGGQLSSTAPPRMASPWENPNIPSTPLKQPGFNSAFSCLFPFFPCETGVIFLRSLDVLSLQRRWGIPRSCPQFGRSCGALLLVPKKHPPPWMVPAEVRSSESHLAAGLRETSTLSLLLLLSPSLAVLAGSNSQAKPPAFPRCWRCFSGQLDFQRSIPPFSRCGCSSSVDSSS